MPSRIEQRERTRRDLVRVSRRLFADVGYADVGLAEIVRTAGVTKGALYHHFDGKEALFRAVLTEVQQEVAQRVAAAADAEDDPWEQFTAGCREFLAAGTAPDVQQIMLIDGPAVLGWTEWRAIDEAAAGRHLAEALAALVDRGLIPPQPVAPLTHLLSGAMNEVALWLARTSDPAAFPDAVAALTTVLTALRAPAPPR
ncbi:TetR family transcriptional regulator [Sphaerisporangium rufum]|uniref:TetR family transcriptional regulator n=1 Tax=Sphaerisporangium rufum TaxID=1381558 RepID=A0A919R5H8_9ACTN|nr:TetR/AcrR family transcriptional regulator [Sphaerisporangium rufum]GII79493.1 TetR family transcriptional regulator [Sphaerisporangium rufum]